MSRWRGLLLVVATLLLSAVVELGAVYHFTRSYTVDLGAPGDSPFVSGFYADEPDIDYRYRWSRGVGEVRFEGAGSARASSITVRAQAAPLEASGPLTMSVSLNGVVLRPEVFTLTTEMRGYAFEVPPGTVLGPPYTLTITSTTFRPEGDPRVLGAKVDSASLQLAGGGMNLPPWLVVAWALIFVVALVGLPSRWPVAPAVVAGVFALIVLGLCAALWPLYLAAYLPFVAAPLALLGLVLWWWPRLPRWPRPAGRLHRAGPERWVMLGAMVLFAAVAGWAISQSVWIGHADYADNANVARSFVEGRGLTVDYVAQFYRDYPGITHPAETWPLLQPLLISPFFALFGPQTWAAKLPNLLVLLALVWVVSHAATRLWDGRVGLLAGLMTLLHPYFFNTVLYPINDLGFTAIFFALAWLLWRRFDYERPTGEDEGTEAKAGGLRGQLLAPDSTLRTVMIGALAGLLIWSKPSGATLLVGVGVWALWAWGRGGEKKPAPWRSLGIAAGAFGVVVLPLIVRNLLAFGSPFFSTESLDAYILRYWPYHDWENIYNVYVGAADYPHARWIAGGKFGYANLFDAIGTNIRWVWEKGVMGGVKNSEYVIGPWLLALSALGAVVLSRRAGRLFGMVGAGFAVYGAFVLLYWHFEGRYFQAAIPWLYMLTAWAVIWLWDRLRGLVEVGRSAVVAWAVVPLAAIVLLWPAFVEVRDFLRYDTRPTSFTQAMDWLSKNSSPDDIVMTRDPWELNWYTRRRAVMIPNADYATIERIAKQYGATMLQLGGPTDGIDIATCPPDPAMAARFPTGSRPTLGSLYCGYERPGFTKVYQNGDLTIYRWEVK